MMFHNKSRLNAMSFAESTKSWSRLWFGIDWSLKSLSSALKIAHDRSAEDERGITMQFFYRPDKLVRFVHDRC